MFEANIFSSNKMIAVLWICMMSSGNGFSTPLPVFPVKKKKKKQLAALLKYVHKSQVLRC